MHGRKCYHMRNLWSFGTLKWENIKRMKCIAYSADINPIEHVWDVFVRHVSQRIHPPQIVQELKNFLWEKAEKITQRLLNSLVDSMNKRCKICTSVRGGFIPYWETAIYLSSIRKELFMGLQNFSKKRNLFMCLFIFCLLSRFPMWCDTYHFTW